MKRVAVWTCESCTKEVELELWQVPKTCECGAENWKKLGERKKEA